jgi:hypothetical protein
VTDDPWRKPDPPPAVPPPPPPYPTYPGPPPYGPPNAYQTPYGPPPYGQYNPNNPYNAPLPQPGGIGRLLWILCGAGLLLLGGCGVGIYFLAHSLTKNADDSNSARRISTCARLSGRGRARRSSPRRCRVPRPAAMP